MQSKIYNPGPPLSAYVSCLWYWESAPCTHAMEKLMPNGEADIIFNLGGNPIRIYDANDLSKYSVYGQVIFDGPRSQCIAIDTEQQERVVGVEFLPGGAFPFLGMPASEIENARVNLQDLWSRETVSALTDQLLEANDPDRIFQVLESFLVHQLRRSPEVHPAVAYALEQLLDPTRNVKMAEVSDRVGLSQKRFIDVFRREVGLTPKVFHRVRRFHNVLRMVHLRPNIDWIQVALSCGYYDQAHFIHDFQAFSGLTPTAYVSLWTEHLNHVRLAQA